MLHYSDVVRSQVFQGGDRLGEVRAWDLHFFDFIEVRLRSTKVVERASDIGILAFRSNDYSKNLGISSEWKALLLNKVVVGNGKKLTQDDTSLTEPPPGYDSVSVFALAFLRVC